MTPKYPLCEYCTALFVLSELSILQTLNSVRENVILSETLVGWFEFLRFVYLTLMQEGHYKFWNLHIFWRA